MTSFPSHALSIRQPWAALIVAGLKDVENRNWRTTRLGPVLIHAGKTKATRDDWASARAICDRHHGKDAFDAAIEQYGDLGGIIGSVVIDGCLSRATSPWFFGRYGFLLSNPTPLPFSAIKGQLGFFPVSFQDYTANRTDN